MRNNERNIDLDELIKRALQEEMEDIPSIPDKAEAWRSIRGKLGKKRKDKRIVIFFRKSIPILAASFGLLFLLILFSSSAPTGTAVNQISQLFSSKQGDAVQMFGGSRETLPSDAPPPPPDNIPSPGEIQVMDTGEEWKMTKMSLKEAQAEAAFQISVPKLIPQGYQLKDVSVYRFGERKSDEATLNYEKDGHILTINEKYFQGDFGWGGFVNNEHATVKEIFINGKKGILILFDNSTSELMWMTPNQQFTIRGDLSEEEIMTIARSM